MAEYSSDDPVWNVMTQTRGGVVSLLKNLTEDQARGLMQRLRKPLSEGNPWSDGAIKRRARLHVEAVEFNRLHPGRPYVRHEQGHACTDGDLLRVECWGPPGVEMEIWPKPDDYEERYATAVATEKANRAVTTAEREAGRRGYDHP